LRVNPVRSPTFKDKRQNLCQPGRQRFEDVSWAFKTSNGVDSKPFFGYHSGVRSLIGQTLGGIAGIAIAAHIIKGVQYDGQFSTLLLIGFVLGILNYLIKPLLELITFPLRLLTLNLFSIVIMMTLVWIADIVVARPQFEITGLEGIFWTAMIVWLASLLFEASLSKLKK